MSTSTTLRLWRIAVFLAALAPLAWWSWQVVQSAAGPDPGHYLLLNTGQGGLCLLLATLALTPLTRLTRWRGFTLIRRQLGLWSLAYAALHLLCYALFILGLDWHRLGSELIQRPYMVVGALALLGLALLGATSNRHAMRKLGKRWKPLHRLSYVILALVLLHYLWVVRADLGQWSLYAATGGLLLLLRLPPLARRLPELRRAWQADHSR
ncbi:MULTISPECIES: protein-methionine-sulfoxide reductase heme-binding subunit MsrQ [unclassified Halomonas]|uniref:protein-methionine-sulfoxide reductase heme-binding subunit MsrQ n=1 Tax=Halomonadaceae TaxID=28256 RepID=UPI001598567B|nr:MULTISPECIES: protein-methionine-sulfoxide reductase heme-binding subunit MsrQ [Halomonas]QJQ96478.1 protein-methionine-sulfoxide reductase heme-binding subunit MsrQ [Halomonas sp. PA5]